MGGIVPTHRASLRAQKATTSATRSLPRRMYGGVHAWPESEHHNAPRMPDVNGRFWLLFPCGLSASRKSRQFERDATSSAKRSEPSFRPVSSNSRFRPPDVQESGHSVECCETSASQEWPLPERNSNLIRCAATRQLRAEGVWKLGHHFRADSVPPAFSGCRDFCTVVALHVSEERGSRAFVLFSGNDLS